jgi:DNA mismatch repair ATPase MutS
MIRLLIKIGLILVVGILVYNYFLGTAEEKETSMEIFNEVKDLGKATWSLLKSEKEKFDQGKYDEALSKIEDIFNRLKGQADRLQNEEWSDQINSLEERRRDIQQQLKEVTDDQQLSDDQKEAIRRDFDQLMKDTEELMDKMEKNEK